METEQKIEKMHRYPGNFPITKEDKTVFPPKINKDAFVHADKFFYFSKERISFTPFGRVNEDIYNLIIAFIEEITASGMTIKQITSRAKQIE